MVHTRVMLPEGKKTEECMSLESVLFNSDSLFKIASYLPADDLLKLALTCRRFGIGGDDDGVSLVEETARMIVQNIATEEYHREGNWLCKYNLVLRPPPLTFDQLVGGGWIPSESSVTARIDPLSPAGGYWKTAFSNNTMMAGKHYVFFDVCNSSSVEVDVGVMRPGEGTLGWGRVRDRSKIFSRETFIPRRGSLQYNSNINYCTYSTHDGSCYSHDLVQRDMIRESWEGMEVLSGSFTVGMLLDLDEGTLSVYNNRRKLGVMKSGLAGHYCWVVSLVTGSKVTIKRGKVPAS